MSPSSFCLSSVTVCQTQCPETVRPCVTVRRLSYGKHRHIVLYSLLNRVIFTNLFELNWRWWSCKIIFWLWWHGMMFEQNEGIHWLFQRELTITFHSLRSILVLCICSNFWSISLKSSFDIMLVFMSLRSSCVSIFPWTWSTLSTTFSSFPSKPSNRFSCFSVNE